MDEEQTQPPLEQAGPEPAVLKPAPDAGRYPELARKPAVARRSVWRGLALFTAALLAVAVGAAYLWQWLHGLRGLELLRFVSLYLCLPLGLSLLLLFAALQKRNAS